MGADPARPAAARTDEAAHAWIAERLVAATTIDPDEAPAGSTEEEVAIEAAG